MSLMVSIKKIVIRDNRIAGIVLYGDTKDSNRLFRMLTKREDISGMTSVSILEASGCCGGGGEAGDVAAMADDELVCGCNGVTKGTIVEAIRTNELTTVDEVGGCTNAGRSCGRCKSLISDILAYTLGDQYDTSAKKAGICGCTTLSKDEVVAEIREKGLTNVREVMNVLAGLRRKDVQNAVRQSTITLEWSTMTAIKMSVIQDW